MSATTRTQEPAYARRSDCPTWCVEHWWDVLPDREPIFQTHVGRLSRGDHTVMLSRWPDGTEHEALDSGDELLPGDALECAALLVEAHGVLDRG